MRVWLYDLLTNDADLQGLMGGVEGIMTRVVPRESQSTINIDRPFIVYGLGNATAESLVDSTDENAQDPERQFSQIWAHDESGDYALVDSIIMAIRRAVTGASSVEHGVLTTRYLETSQEFGSEQYKTIFRYVRFQHIIAQGVPA